MKNILLLFFVSLTLTSRGQDVYLPGTPPTEGMAFAETNRDRQPAPPSARTNESSHYRAGHEFHRTTPGKGSSLAGDLVINEFMADNVTTRADQDGEFDDWIELYNNTAGSISLDGFHLSDDPGNLTKWAFPAGTTIAGNGYLIIWADEDIVQDGLHAAFRLAAAGEAVALVGADGAIVDTVTYAAQATDVSHGRFPNGTGNFQDMTPTFNAVNVEDTPGPADTTLTTSPLAGDLVINEFLAANDSTQADQDGEFDDWIELYNNTATGVSLAGFYLSDDPGNPTKWAFPAGTTIAGNGYLIIWADEDADQEGLHAGIRLSAAGETLLLVDANRGLIDSLTYTGQTTDISYGRSPNGTGGFGFMTPTFNAENTNGITRTRYEPLVGAELALFPNPTQDRLNVRLKRAYPGDLRFRLLDAEGRLLRERTLPRGGTTLEIDASGLPEGFYSLAVTDGRATETHKVVVRR